MQTLCKNNQLDFTGENIYAGIDVHLKSWTVSLETNGTFLKTFNQPPEPDLLNKYLRKNFPGAKYSCSYEAGFCGFWIHDKFIEMGIDCIVVNPIDVPTTDKEKKQKGDKIDSRKIARSLRNGELEGIYVHSQESREHRGLIRCRKKFVKDLTRCKNRTKSFLYFNGIQLPEPFSKRTPHWSNKFTNWLESIKMKTSQGTITLKAYTEAAKMIRKLQLNVTKEIRKLSESDKYIKHVQLLNTIGGIGPTSSMILLTELGDIHRFKDLNNLCSYVGLIPNTSSSGEKDRIGEMTNRGNHLLKETIIECSWIAIRQDPALLMKFKQLCKRMEANKAIIRIARSLLNRIRFVLKNEKPYVNLVV